MLRISSFAVPVLLPWLLACSGSEDPISDCACLAPLHVNLVVEGGASDNLLALQLPIEELRFLTPGQEVDDPSAFDVISEPLEVELVGLVERGSLVAERYLNAGTYDRLWVGFGAQARGMDLAGAELEWELRDGVALVLEESLALAGQELLGRSLVLSIDVDESLGLDASGAAVLRPIIRAAWMTEKEPLAFDDFYGEAFASSQTFAANAWSSGPPYGTRPGIEAEFPLAGLAMFDSMGQPLPDLAALQELLKGPGTGATVRGTLISGGEYSRQAVALTSIQYEGDFGSQGPTNTVIAEGRIVDWSGGSRLDLRFAEFEQGEEFGEEVRLGLSDPATFDVRLLDDCLLLDDADFLLDRSSLAVGMRVKIQFSGFGVQPFPATRLTLLEGPQHHGVLSQAGADPLEFRLLPDAAAIEAGLVNDERTSVGISLDSPAALDVLGRPELPVERLRPGLRVLVDGVMRGNPGAPNVESAGLVVLPGRFEGSVTSMGPAGGTFSASVEVVHAAFGGDTASPPFFVKLDPGCIFEGELDSPGALQTAFAGLQAGQRLSVEVSGVAGADSNTIRAYQVRAQVQ